MTNTTKPPKPQIAWIGAALVACLLAAGASFGQAAYVNAEDRPGSQWATVALVVLGTIALVAAVALAFRMRRNGRAR